MPLYDYHCKDCDKPFVIEASIKDSRENAVCSACNSKNIYRVFAQVGLTSLPTRGANSLSKSTNSTSSETSSETASKSSGETTTSTTTSTTDSTSTDT